MNVSKLSPWNWFRKEETPAARAMPMPVPVRRNDPLSRLHQEMDRLFEDFFNGVGWTFPGVLTETGERYGAPSVLHPQLDIAETRDAYTVTVEVPGVDEKDIEISIQDDTLTLSGEKRRESSEGDGHFHRVERTYGHFQRTLALPGDADADNITANFNNGVLTVNIPRLEGVQSERGRRIPIGNGNARE